jgi:hypothetical protein
MLNVATPPPSTPEPRSVDPSKNQTLPVAVAGITTAEKVTNCPGIDGFGPDDKVVDVAGSTAASKTVTLSPD